MKKVILTLAVMAGITATAQVKVGSDVLNLATNANFQVEGTTPAEQFMVLKNGNVGIGTTTPDFPLSIYNKSTVNNVISMRSPSPNANYIAGSSSSGTLTAPTAQLANGNIISIIGGAHDGSAWNLESVGIYMRTAEAQTPTNHGTYMEFATTPIGSSAILPTLRMSLLHDGTLSLINTPTITTATKVLVKDANNIISEQVVNGTVITPGAAVAPLAGDAFVAPAGGGVIVNSTGGIKWKITVSDAGVVTTTKSL